MSENYYKNLHLHNLLDENEELKKKIAKLEQIEDYVEILLAKIDKYQENE